MAATTRRALLILLALLALLLLAIAGYIASGRYNIGADAPHTEAVRSILEAARARSIAVRADDLRVPDLGDRRRMVQGAGNYDAMCTGCHLAPGRPETEMSRGLYPAPPDLTRHRIEPARAFWVVKHGIKASGMPAWGRSMGDEYIWNMVAFLQVLPDLDPAGYQGMVDSSGGHSHGGGETGSHSGQARAAAPAAGGGNAHPHPSGAPANHHDAGGDQGAQPRMTEHRHADGTVESHPTPAAPADHDDDHHH